MNLCQVSEEESASIVDLNQSYKPNYNSLPTESSVDSTNVQDLHDTRDQVPLTNINALDDDNVAVVRVDIPEEDELILNSSLLAHFINDMPPQEDSNKLSFDNGYVKDE